MLQTNKADIVVSTFRHAGPRWSSTTMPYADHPSVVAH
jgi:hypothetical protein